VRLRLAVVLLFAALTPALADMYQDASNATFPNVLDNLKLGPATPGLAVTDMPVIMRSIGPPPPGPAGGGAGLRSTLLVEAITGPTPVGLSNPFMYGAILRAAQQVGSGNTGQRGAEYIGVVGVGEMSFPEGGWATTLTAPALAGATSITVADPSKIVAGGPIRIIQGNDTLRHVTAVGLPTGNVVTITPALQVDTPAGAYAYMEMGYVRGIIGQGTMYGTAQHSGVEAAEFAVSTRTGAVPAFRTIVGISTNFDDDVQAYTPLDAGLALWGNNTSLGYKAGIQFDNRGSKHLVATDGTLIRALGGNFGNGLDFSTSTFTGYSLKMPGMTLAAEGRLALSGSFPDIRIRDTNSPINSGGLWRISAVSGGITWQSNTDPAGNFTPAVSPLVLLPGSLQISGGGAQLLLRATATAIDAGGLWRTVLAAGAWTLQSNTAAAGDFSTALSTLSINKDGDIYTAATTALPVGSVFKHLYIPTTAGAPTGAAAGAAAGRTAVVWDSTDKKLCAYNQPTSAWACSAAFTP
jgi:hypothetical protein